jgi:hypothetical protein
MDRDVGAGLADEKTARQVPGAWRLALVLLALFATFALVIRLARQAPAPARNRFDTAPLKALHKKKPDYVLIGNSMVKTRFHERTLDRLLAPRRSLLVTNDSSRSAMWYAMFKNYVIASGQHPRRVVFFFRDLELTAPRAGTGGDGKWRLERVSLPEEPVIEARLSPAWTDPVERLRYLMEQQVPVRRLREEVRPFIDELGLRLAGVVAASPSRVEVAEINEAFALGNLRPAPQLDQVPELPARRLDERFSALVDDSFLPDILGLAEEHGIPIAFVRIRTRAAARGVPESEALSRYQQALRDYFEARRIPLYDLTHATWEDLGFYAMGDHLDTRRRPAYTRLFVKHVRDVFD